MRAETLGTIAAKPQGPKPLIWSCQGKYTVRTELPIMKVTQPYFESLFPPQVVKCKHRLVLPNPADCGFLGGNFQGFIWPFRALPHVHFDLSDFGIEKSEVEEVEGNNCAKTRRETPK
jgi:hypothetical protein